MNIQHWKLLTFTTTINGPEPMTQQTIDNPEQFVFTDDKRTDIERALEIEHGACDSGYCDISAAMRAGFPFAAAHLLLGATETPVLDVVYAHYEIDARSWPDEWDEWTAWFKENSVECEGCGSFNFTDDGWPYTCANCGVAMPDEPEDDE